MPVVPGQFNANYTPISTAGTTTINPGQGAEGPGVGVAIPGAFFGATVTNMGTATGTFTAAVPAITVYDIVPQQGTVASSTNTLLVATATAMGQSLAAGIYDIAPRYRGALVAVTTVTNGTAGAFNVLWD